MQRAHESPDGLSEREQRADEERGDCEIERDAIAGTTIEADEERRQDAEDKRYCSKLPNN